MVGEMRDLETANIATQAALTGHLVLSTLHTNNAGSSLTRLLEMGIEDYLLASTVNGIFAQRLVRTLCGECRRHRSPTPTEASRFGSSPEIPFEYFWEAVGCEQCHGGYNGRTSIAEFLQIDEPIRKMIIDHVDGSSIQNNAIEMGMRTLWEDGIRKAANGITTVVEVMRVSATIDNIQFDE